MKIVHSNIAGQPASAIMAKSGQLQKVDAIKASELIDPNSLASLPAKYNIVMSDPTVAERMYQLGTRLKQKHPSWKQERIMRKLFEAFPSVRIKILEDDIS